MDCELLLAQASVSLKPVDWHSLRVQRNTIISKDFIEVFVDGALVLSVEDQALGLGQVGLVVRWNIDRVVRQLPCRSSLLPPTAFRAAGLLTWAHQRAGLASNLPFLVCLE